MKVGDYVRTKHYGIAKIVNAYNNTTTFYSSITIDKIDSFGRLGVSVSNDEIIKSSPNIIDLIEVGDYVNGCLVLDIAQAPKMALYLLEKNNHCALIPRTNEELPSIVTKEQFESMEYKVG